VTKKELIEGGWIDKYVLGLTTEEESQEVERMAHLYPDIQDQVNAARNKICGSFNRKLTNPVFHNSFLTKRRIIRSASFIVFVSLAAFAFLWLKHFDLRETYHSQCAKSAADQAKLAQMSSFSKKVTERSAFINSSSTERIKVKGCDSTPDAEVLVFKCRNSGKMMLQVVDLPGLQDGQHYEVWTQWGDSSNHMIGLIEPPIKYDSMYVLSSELNYTRLQITAVDPANNFSQPVCMADVDL
jgi:anti-sigma-K factor RskA